MIDMSSWDVVEADPLLNLDLDPLNVRLVLPTDARQQEILHALYAQADVLDLVESIVAIGYLLTDAIITVRRDSRLVVVEGNRRVAALKGLLNPTLVPGYGAQLRKLAASFTVPESVKQLDVYVAPSQDEADQVIAHLHTSSPRKSWPRHHQTEFFQRYLNDGWTIADLTERFAASDVWDFVRRYRTQHLFAEAVREWPDLHSYIISAQFPATVLEYVYESREFVQYVGLTLDSEAGTVSVSVAPETFKAVAKKVIEDIKAGDINTRKLNTVPARKAYVEKIRLELLEQDRREQAEDTSGPEEQAGGGTETPESEPGASSTEATDTGTAESSDAKAQSTQRPPRRKRQPKSPTLDCEGLVPFKGNVASFNLLEELRTSRVKDYPNATMFLIRVFLEKSIKAYAALEAQNIPRKRGKYVYLSDCLEWLEGHVRTDVPALHNVIRDFRSSTKRDQFHLSAEWTDNMLHNHMMDVTEEEVRQMWGKILPVFQFLLHERDTSEAGNPQTT